MTMNDGVRGAGLDVGSRRAIDKFCRRAKSAAVVFVNTGDVNSYGVVVNLGRNGVPILSVDSNRKNSTFASRYATKILSPDYREAEADFIDFLASIGARLNPKPVLFVNGDEQLMVLLRNWERLERHFLFPFAPYDLAERLVNKTSFYRMLQEYSVPHAETFLPETVGDVKAFAGRLNYPFILKPAQSQSFAARFDNKCISVDSPTELLDRYQEVVAAVEGRIVVQKEIAGAERYLVYTYFSKDSIPLGVCCYRKVRIYPTDFGNACVCESMRDTEVIDLCIDLLKKIRYRGLAEAEIQRDAGDGQLKLVEINARTTVQSRLPAKCGVNMEYIAYRDALGFEQQPLINEDLGVLWIDLYRDSLSVLSPDGYLAQDRISIPEWLHSLRGRRVFTYFAWDDPVPSFIRFYRLLVLHLFNRKRLGSVRVAFSSMFKKKATE